MGYELARDACDGLGEPRANGVEMTAKAAFEQEMMHRGGGKGGITKSRRQLHVDDRLAPVRPRDQIGDAQGRRHRLGKASDLDDAIETVQGRKPWTRRRLEVGVDVIFDDRDP